MDSMEFNKIAGATIGALLLFLLLNFFSGLIYGTREAGEHAVEGEEHGPVLAYAVAIEAGEAGGGEAEPQVDLLALFEHPDPAAGERTFRACGACHAIEPGVNKVGPPLHDVVGSDIAAVDGFAYSDAMAALEGDWTPEFLFDFLGNPQGVVPGTKMSFAGVKNPQDRANVVAYLNQIGDTPVDLTEGIEPLAPAGGEEQGAEGAAGAAEGGTGQAATAPARVIATDEAIAEGDGAADGAAETAGGAAEGSGPPVTTAESATETTASSVPGEQGVTVVERETVNVEDENVDVGSVTPLEITEAAPREGGTTDAGPSERPAGEGTQAGAAPAEGQAEGQAAAPAEGQAASVEGQAPAEGQAAGGGEQVAVAPAAGAMPAGDAAAGERLFRRCMACHKLEPGVNTIGPTLHGVIGREVASVEGYSYSDAMRAHGGVWSPERLAEYLANPKGAVPGTKMAFAGLKNEQDRIDVMTYLQQVAQ